MHEPRYSAIQIGLHWLVAVLVLVQWLTYDAIVRTHNPLLHPRIIDLFEHKVHNYGGIAIGLLIGLRVMLRVLRRGRAGKQDWTLDAVLAALVHTSLYVLLFLQALTGFAASYITPSAVPLHKALWTLVWPLIALHVAAAGWHLIRRDGVVRRMWFGAG